MEPTLLGNKVLAHRLIGLAKLQLEILKTHMSFNSLKQYSRLLKHTDGSWIEVSKSFSTEAITIFVPLAANKIISVAQDEYSEIFKGFLFNPRTLAENSYSYPLIDNDHKTAGTIKKEAGWKVINKPPENYGNLYWINSEDYPTVLSWKGTPTRHFALPTETNVSGLSILETSLPGTFNSYYEDIPVYTPFGTWLYRGGNRFKQSPKWSWPYDNGGVAGRCLILGACKNITDNNIYIVTQSDHYNAPSEILLGNVVHSLTKPGIFLTLWKSGTQYYGWDFISEVKYSRNGLPWFGNADGTEFVCDNGDKLSITGILTIKDIDYGNYSESGTDTVKTLASFVGKSYFEYKDNELVWSDVTATFEGNTSFTNTPSKIYDEVEEVVMKLENEPEPLSISGPDVYTPGAYSAVGGTSPYEWTYPTAVCGTAEVLVTDACGDVARKTVRMPTGVWRPVNPEQVWGCATAGGDTVYATSGGTRVRHCIVTSGCGRRVPDDGYSYNCTGGKSVSFDPTTVCSSIITSAPVCVPDCETTYNGYTYTGACKKCIDGSTPFIDTWECT